MDVAPVYETKAAEEDPEPVKKMLAAGEIDYVTFASSSTVKYLAEMLGDASLIGKAKVVAIGPVTAKTCEELGISVQATPESYTIDAMAETVARLAASEEKAP